MREAVAIEQFETTELFCDIVSDACLTLVVGRGGRQLTEVDDMVTNTRNEFYGEVRKNVYLLYLVTPQIIVHNGLSEGSKIGIGEGSIDIARNDYHVAGILRVRHHTTISINVVVFALDTLNASHWNVLGDGDKDVSLSGDVTLCRLDKRHAHKLALDTSWIDIGNILTNRIHAFLDKECLYLVGIKKSVDLIIGDIDDYLGALLRYISGFVPRGNSHEEVAADEYIDAYQKGSLYVNVYSQ